MNVFEKEKKRQCPFSFVKAKAKERKKASGCESAAYPASSSGKGSFLNQDEWLREVEEHERKSATGEKQSVEMSSLEPFQNRLEEAEEGRLQHRRCPPAPKC